jgi:hypothetical protein
MNKNMTSIEWLIDQLTNVKYNPLEKHGYSKAVEKIHEQAKEMHKQEIIDSYNTGYLDCQCNHINDADQHYHQLTQKG